MYIDQRKIYVCIREKSMYILHFVKFKDNRQFYSPRGYNLRITSMYGPGVILNHFSLVTVLLYVLNDFALRSTSKVQHGD